MKICVGQGSIRLQGISIHTCTLTLTLTLRAVKTPDWIDGMIRWLKLIVEDIWCNWQPGLVFCFVKNNLLIVRSRHHPNRLNKRKRDNTWNVKHVTPDCHLAIVTGGYGGGTCRNMVVCFSERKSCRMRIVLALLNLITTKNTLLFSWVTCCKMTKDPYLHDRS